LAAPKEEQTCSRAVEGDIDVAATVTELSASEVDQAFRVLMRYDTIVLAVSGGPDSLALLYLAAEWCRRIADKAIDVHVVTVDHRLREASHAEAVAVGAHADRLGLKHTILEWANAKPETGLANAARQARYALLEAYARQQTQTAGAAAIVTAHHIDDQAETVLMRLARGSGLDGLAAMAETRPLAQHPSIDLVRPLLAFSKARLIATLNARAVAYADDPTNADIAYERVRVRNAMAELADIGLTPQELASSAKRLGAARDALAYAAVAFETSVALALNNEVYASLDRQAFAAGPAYLQQRLLARLIARFGGASPKPRLAEVEALAARLAEGGKASATLGGAIVSAGSRLIRIWREAGRLKSPAIEMAPGTSLVWDDRFIVSYSADYPKSVTIRPLGSEGYLDLTRQFAHVNNRPPSRAAHALPAFWSEGQVLAVPTLVPFLEPDAKAALQPAGLDVRALAATS
jgi:tRNA(Ile)-lysidine synthase